MPKEATKASAKNCLNSSTNRLSGSWREKQAQPFKILMKATVPAVMACCGHLCHDMASESGFCTLSSAKLCFVACKNVKSRRSSCLEARNTDFCGRCPKHQGWETKRARWTSSLQLPSLHQSLSKLTRNDTNSKHLSSNYCNLQIASKVINCQRSLPCRLVSKQSSRYSIIFWTNQNGARCFA